MVTNDERRKVARRLREVNPYRNQSHTIPYYRYTPAAEYLSELAEALGYSPKNDVSRLEFQNRLADLIEPPTQCGNSEQPYEIEADLAEMQGKRVLVLRGDQGAPDAIECDGKLYEEVDRDALLALADDIDKQTDGSMFDAWLEDGHYIARRIREALGVNE